jgi:hypothetical protein
VLVLGVAAICSRRVRRSGGARWAAGIALIGLVWIGLIDLLGANQASNIASNYGYLADPGQSATMFHIVKGAASHPARLTHVLSMRWRAILFELLPTGFVGLVTPWGFFFFIGVLIPFALTNSFAYSVPTGGAFQNLPAMPFIFIGSLMVITRLATSAPRRQWLPQKRATAIAIAVAVLATVLSLGQGATMIQRIPRDWLLVDTAQARALDRATAIIPPDAEVICSYGIMGRFAERKYILALAAAPQTLRVGARTVFFVITPFLGYEELNPADATADIEFVQTELRARLLIDEKGVSVLEWTPPPGTRTVVLSGKNSPVGNSPGP